MPLLRDLPDASFAGQQETYLNIRGEAALLSAVQNCWASLYGARAIYYRAKQGFEESTVNIAVVVQQWCIRKRQVLCSPPTRSRRAAHHYRGLVGSGRGGRIWLGLPDHYIFDQRTESIGEKTIANKKVWTPILTGPTVRKWLPLMRHGRMRRYFPTRRSELATYGKIAENHYGMVVPLVLIMRAFLLAGSNSLIIPRPCPLLGDRDDTSADPRSYWDNRTTRCSPTPHPRNRISIDVPSKSGNYY